jgi:hypothetical protein
LVLVHTEGAEAAAKLLLTEHEQTLQAKQQGPAAAGRKGKASALSSSGSGSARRDQAAAAASSLLSMPAVNGFLLGVVSIAGSYQQEGADEEAESAAQAAMQVAGALFKPQLVAVSISTAGGSTGLQIPDSTHLQPDAVTWACLAQMYAVLGDWQQLSNIVSAAVRQQLPGVALGDLQAVLAGAAAALNSAGKHVAAVKLLDQVAAAGVAAVSHPQLAQQLMDAADKSSEAEQVRTITRWCHMFSCDV